MHVSPGVGEWEDEAVPARWPVSLPRPQKCRRVVNGLKPTGYCRAPLPLVSLCDAGMSVGEFLDWAADHAAQYHPPLVNCMLAMVEKEPSLGIMMVRGITKAWPTAWQANSLKEMLLLDEAEQLFGKMASLGTAADAAAAVMAFVPSLLSTAESENGRVAERALRLLAGKVVLGILSPDSLSKQRRKLMGQIMPAILKGGAKHWSDSVNVKRGALLRALHELDPDAFAAEADALWGPGGISETQGLQSQASRRAADELEEQRRNQSGGGMRRPAGGLGSPSTLSRTTTAPPPLPRGVVPHMAPPPVRLPASSKRDSDSSDQGAPPAWVPTAAPWTPSSGGPPPVTVTGVAPWAMKAGNGGGAAARPKFVPKFGAAGASLRDSEEAGSEVTGDDQESCLPMEVDPERPAWSGGNEGSGDHTEAQASGCERVLEFAGSLSPPEEEQVAEANPDDALQSLTPTLLPDLGFQELVFGHTLGTGAFSTVRHAWHIHRGKAKATWPAYAVKCISTTTIRDMGYEASVRREVAVLRVLSHPGVARLVASFRWRDGAYLVLEYASKGDLHSQIAAQGKLDETCTRFWMGEVTAALQAVHDTGFVYGDLKPENILLTEGGHAKLGDFGAARPATEKAKEMVSASSTAIKNMRCGDWRVKMGVALPEEEQDRRGEDQAESLEESDTDDGRMEGTACYLAPELARGAPTSIAGDCWALGCTIYQCFVGHPPLLADTQEMAIDRIVGFTPASLEFPADFSPDGKDLVLALLNPDPERRLGAGPRGLEEVRDHPFFSGLDIPALYRLEAPAAAQACKPPSREVLEAGAPRRQSSIMWTPTTTSGSYSFVGGAYAMQMIEEMDSERACHFRKSIPAAASTSHVPLPP
ncbi:hypothetical protein CYMTET_6290 [Cymbomonas tetramitiformis]|uniref:non-specific serine/threonine protein kinase n=1 Tax=Cymbomonas tetramitiformis TaxID=36881 RepID=A0AAE0GXR5_9CHLO|nr:hypothetical protein CYMTET_6290 [Cymbomonas tetramitiformis]